MEFDSIPKADLSAESLERLDRRSEECGAAFRRKIEKFESKIIEARDRFTRDNQGMLDRAEPSERATVREIVRRDVEQKTSQFRRELVENTRQEREEVLEALTKNELEVIAMNSLCKSPGQMLGRVGLGDPKRTQIQLQLTGAGPIELESAATDAIARGDMVAASAIFAVVDRMERGKRPFSPAALAEKVIGEQFETTRARLREVTARFKSARSLNHSFETGTSNPTERIEAGLAARQLQPRGEKDGAA